MARRFLFPFAFAALAALPCASSAAPAPGTGRAIYKQRCAACHGDDGSGDTGMGRSFKLRDLRSPDVQKQTDAQLTDIVMKGRNGRMPAFAGSLGPEKVAKVVAYMRTMKARK